MLSALPRPKVSGSFPVSATLPTRLVRIPANAMEPARLDVRNTDAGAILYLKFVSLNSGEPVSATDHGIVLYPLEAKTWQPPPGECDLIALSSVDASMIAIDGHWKLSDQAVLL